jgi:hypothetical protein
VIWRSNFATRSAVLGDYVMSSFAASSIGLLAFCSVGCTFENALLAELDKDYGLVDSTGIFGQMRTMQFLRPGFETRGLLDSSYVFGVSSTGDHLLLSTQSGRNQYLLHDEVDIATLQLQVVSRIQPAVLHMLVLRGELSSDGNLIAFVGSVARRYQDVRYGLHLLKVSGDICTLVETAERELPTSIGWSRDGKAIVYDSGDRIFLYNLDTKISTLLGVGSYPTWSPDGSWIAFRRRNGTAALVKPDGAESKDVLGQTRLGAGLRWSPDSRYLLYADFSQGGIRVRDVSSDRMAIVFYPVDSANTYSGLRWVRRVRNLP